MSQQNKWIKKVSFHFFYIWDILTVCLKQNIRMKTLVLVLVLVLLITHTSFCICMLLVQLHLRFIKKSYFCCFIFTHLCSFNQLQDDKKSSVDASEYKNDEKNLSDSEASDLLCDSPVENHQTCHNSHQTGRDLWYSKEKKIEKVTKTSQNVQKKLLIIISNN